MSIFSKVVNGKVVNVINADRDFVLHLYDGPGQWVETWKDASTSEKRFNFGGINSNYDKKNDAFYGDSPHASWTLNKSTYQWEPPVEYPSDGERYLWNEESQSWNLAE